MASRRLALLYRRIHAYQNSINTNASLPSCIFFYPVVRQFSQSAIAFKVRKTDKDKKKDATVNIVHAQHAQNPLVQDAIKEMEALENILDGEVAKHFSAKVDLRLFEDIPVVLDNGEEHRMNRLGRVTLKTPQMVMINFADNPTAIKPARVALQKSSLAVNPQQEGIVLYINVPRMTRERREELAHSAKTTMLNDFKEALNKVYIKYDKKSTIENKSHDVAVSTRNLLLMTKRSFEQRAAEKIAVQQQELMKEIA